MNSAAVQRFAITVVLFGGFLELSRVIQDAGFGLIPYGTLIMSLGVCISLLGLALEM